jgi:hypothetical protein
LLLSLRAFVDDVGSGYTHSRLPFRHPKLVSTYAAHCQYTLTLANGPRFVTLSVTSQ